MRHRQLRSTQLRAAIFSLTGVLGLFLGQAKANGNGLLEVDPFKVDVDVGLTKSTLDLLRSYPYLLGQQAETSAEVILSRLDVSVEDYLRRVDKLVQDRVEQISCTAVGAPSAAIDQMMIKFGIHKDLVRGLQRYWEDTHAHGKIKSSPQDLAILYSDFLKVAAATACEAQASGAYEAKREVDMIRDRARRPWKVWNVLETYPWPVQLGCARADECIDSLREQTLVLMVLGSDRRDRDEVRAKERFSQIGEPKSLEAIEAAGAEYLLVQESIQLARLRRERRGAKALAEAKSRLNQAKEALRLAKHELDSLTPDQVNDADARLRVLDDGATARGQDVVGSLALAEATDNRLKPEVETIRSEYQAVLDHLTPLENEARGWLEARERLRKLVGVLH